MQGLPDYDSPPIAEVAMSVQFALLSGLSAAHLGLYWEKISQEFHRAEEHAPLQHIVEPEHALPGGEPPAIMFGLPPPRVWFLNKSGDRLIQLQKDRFVLNWRRTPPGAPYPRYSALRGQFLHYWRVFTDFVSERGLQPLQPDQCELTYLNHVPRGQEWTSPAEASKLFTALKWEARGDSLPEPEAIRWHARFSLPALSGRLHVDVSPVLLPESKEEALRFTLTARGKPSAGFDEGGLLAWFDKAHEQIVRSFADLTTSEADKLWRRMR